MLKQILWELGWEVVYRIELAQYHVQWCVPKLWLHLTK